MLKEIFRKWIGGCMKRKVWVMFSVIVALVWAGWQFPSMRVDTDPENMLPKTEFVRRFHNSVKKTFGVYDYIVLGIVNEKDENGIFNVATLNKIYSLTKQILSIDGVISREVISLSTKDNVRSGSLGEVVFEYLMPSPIKTQKEALQIKEQSMNNPLFYGTIVSEDGKAAAIYIPVERKDVSYKVAAQIKRILSLWKGDEKYFITGLPVAEDTFGVEMFKQMAISAPLAGLLIFLLMYWFFRSIKMIISPMLIAVFTVVLTMGLLIGFGFPVHIMSSMIPIFLMPIAVLDSVHILSEFFDKYPKIKDRQKTIISVMEELFVPMLYTSLTSAVGFFSLSFSPIPPVQVFGIFVAIGVMIAWFLTITFIPAYIAFIPERFLENFGEKQGSSGYLWLVKFGKMTVKYKWWISAVSLVVLIFSVIGISKIDVNDNPVKWFTKSHPIRVADRILNRHFAGTYTVYLVLESKKDAFIEPKMLEYVDSLQKYLLTTSACGKSSSLADLVKKVYSSLMGDKSYYKIPKTRRAVAQCLISFENSHKPDDLWHFTTPDYSKLNVWIQLKSGDNKDVAKLVSKVEEFVKNNPFPVDTKINWAGLTYINLVWQNRMVIGMFKNFLGSFFIVLFMMVLLFRSPIKAYLSMVPLTFSIVFIYGLLGWVGKSYDMPVAVLSALTLGLSIDFAIHFLQRAREIYAKQENQDDPSILWPRVVEEMFSSPAMAIIRNALVVAIGFLPLLAAPLVPYKTVGFFMFAIMATSAVVTLILLPSLISFFPSAVFREVVSGILCNRLYCFLMAISFGGLWMYIMSAYMKVSIKGAIILTSFVILGALAVCPLISSIGYCRKGK